MTAATADARSVTYDGRQPLPNPGCCRQASAAVITRSQNDENDFRRRRVWSKEAFWRVPEDPGALAGA